MARKKKIGLREKVKILEESYEPGCVIAELARKHGISSGVLYRWRTGNKKIGNENGGGLSDTNAESISGSNNKFVEVTVRDAAIERSESNSSSSSAVLRKASLEYDNLVITVEGGQGKRVLPEIMKLMETVA